MAEETKKFHDERDAKLLDQLKNSELNIEGIVKNWEKLFKDNVIDFAEQKGLYCEANIFYAIERGNVYCVVKKL